MSLFQYRSFSKKSILVHKEKSSVAEQGATKKQRFCSKHDSVQKYNSVQDQNSSEAKQFRNKRVQKQK